MPTVTVSGNTTTVVLDTNKGTVTLGSASTAFVDAYLTLWDAQIPTADRNAYGVWNHLKERLRADPEIDVESGPGGVPGSISFLRDWTDTMSEVTELKDRILPGAIGNLGTAWTPDSMVPLLTDSRYFGDESYEAFYIKKVLQNRPASSPRRST